MPRKKKSAGRSIEPPKEGIEEIRRRMLQAGIPLESLPAAQNYVATVNMECRLDLMSIARHARNAEYNATRFSAVIIRIRQPVRATALIFKNGKMVVAGAKCEADSRLAVKKFIRIVQKIGYSPKCLDYRIQNIVGNAKMGAQIRLEGFVRKHINYARWETQIWAGCVYSMELPRMTLLIFTNGKVVFTGAKYIEHMYQAWEMMYPALLGKYCPSLILLDLVC
jgi:transcription initiation factor TFIID TATA-box-binding protein